MIDLNREYTLDGLKVIELRHFPQNDNNRRLLALTRENDGSVSSSWLNESGSERIYGTRAKLIPIPQKITRWFNVYKVYDDGYLVGSGYDSLGDAVASADEYPRYVKTVSKEFEV